MCESLKIPFGMTDGLSNPDMLGIAVEARAADLYGFNPQRVGGWIKTKSQLAQCKQFNVGARVWSELTTPLGQRQMYALASQANNVMFGFGCAPAQAEGPGLTPNKPDSKIPTTNQAPTLSDAVSRLGSPFRGSTPTTGSTPCSSPPINSKRRKTDCRFAFPTPPAGVWNQTWTFSTT